MPFGACEDGSFGKIFGGQSLVPEFRFIHIKNPDAEIHIDGETETGGYSQLVSSMFN